MQVEPAGPRFTIETTGDGVRVLVPARRSALTLLFLSAWMVGWGFGETSAIHQLLSPSGKSPQLFIAAWLAGWTVGGAWVVTTILWQLAGREVVSVGPTTLDHRIEAFGLGRTRSYRLSEVRNLRAVDQPLNLDRRPAGFMPPLTGSGTGPVVFDYGARTLRLGGGLDEAEAKLLVSRLLLRLPRKLDDL